MSLTFGTAGLRGPLKPGPDGINAETVSQAVIAVAQWLSGQCLGGGVVVVGHDARHQSAELARLASGLLSERGFRVHLFPRALPTPITAFAVRKLSAVAGFQVTASHNPAADNGLKVFVSGGAQLISPADREVEAIMRSTQPQTTAPAVQPAGEHLIDEYLATLTALGSHEGDGDGEQPIRIVLSALHGVGGAVALKALNGAGSTDIHVVPTQFDPDPDFPTVDFPNPELPAATKALRALAQDVDADVAIALDPDADRCAVAVPGTQGWEMLSGDAVGALLADYLLRHNDSSADGASTLVATTVVSSRLLSRIAAHHGVRFAETLTGFKWLMRAGDGLVFAYEEAIGYCVDPDHVRDKDGISAAVTVAGLTAELNRNGRKLTDQLDQLYRVHGVHLTEPITIPTPHGFATSMLDAVRDHPPMLLAGEPVECTDYQARRGSMKDNLLVFEGNRVRLAIRPSGTEPLLKLYLEVHLEPDTNVAAAKLVAHKLLERLHADSVSLVASSI